MSVATDCIMALDVGERRIGVALASTAARIANPYVTVLYDEQALTKIMSLADQNHVSRFVVGLPRNMAGEETQQTQTVRSFTEQLRAKTDTPISFQDESVTSVKAKEELEAKGKPYAKEDIDKLAATYILEDYLRGNQQ